jgi:hypothetical protein
MQPCWVALAVVLAFASAADAATFKCGVSWRVSGNEVYQGSITPSKCQTRCEKMKTKCKFFYTTEDVNAPQRGACHIMGSVGWNKYRDDSVVVVCARPKVFGQLGVPVNNTGSSGTFTPAPPSTGRTGARARTHPLYCSSLATPRSRHSMSSTCAGVVPHVAAALRHPRSLAGAYRRVAASTGVVAIHATMLPNSDEIVVFGRPQDNTKYPPQPGMAVGNTRVEWPSAIVNTRTGRSTHLPRTCRTAAPTCSAPVLPMPAQRECANLSCMFPVHPGMQNYLHCTEWQPCALECMEV